MAERVTTPAQERAWAAMRGHRHWVYRACAPSPDVAGMAAGDDTVPVTVWLTRDGEQQKARLGREQAAVALCGRCPMRAMCLDYALGDDAGPYELWDIWGGMTAHQRAGLLKERRRVVAAATARVPSQRIPESDLVVLRALAAHRTERAVADAAGVTVTRANWHRSRLVTALHLHPNTATRMRLLYAARLAGALDPRTPILADRDRVIAAVPHRQGAVLLSHGIQLPIPGLPDYQHRPAPSRTDRAAVAELRPHRVPGPARAEHLEAVA